MLQVLADSKNQFQGKVLFNGSEYPCVLGRGGLVSAKDKKEGDGATPIGQWAMRRVFYRADKIEKPNTKLPLQEIKKIDAWCDDGNCSNYNSLVTLPHDGSYESMWRDDDLYDLVVELGYNDSPVISGKGSAIFMHVMRPEGKPTEGCIAMNLEDLKFILFKSNESTCVFIEKL